MKFLFTSITTFLSIFAIYAQGASVRVAYIDMEYILSKTPEYIEANNQLEQKAAVWKKEADAKKTEIKKLKDNLSAERTLLTRELIEEKEDDITLLENELSEFLQKKFGTKGELITQKLILAKPIQDQIFAVVKDIATAKKFDYVLDKASEATMLYATKRHDISEMVIQRLGRAKKRQNLSSKEIADLEKKDKETDLEDLRKERREALAERKEALEDNKAKKNKSDEINQPKDIKQKQQEELKQKQQALAEKKELEKQKQLALAEKKEAEKQKQKDALEKKRRELEEQKQLADEQKRLLQEEKLKEIELQKAKIEENKRIKEQALKEAQRKREIDLSNQANKNKKQVNVSKIVEERKEIREKKQQELQRKKEIALKERKIAIEENNRKQEENKKRLQKEKEERIKAKEEEINKRTILNK